MYSQIDFADVRGDKHFYPNADDPDGNDLLVEYSILWNPTMMDFKGSANPYITTRFDDGKPLAYWSPAADCPTSDSPYAGSFEWMGNFKVPISDEEVETPERMAPTIPDGNNFKTGDAYADFPNIGGAIQPDAENLDNGHEWGWHRIGVRYHLDIIDEAAVAAGTAGNKLTDYVGKFVEPRNYYYAAGMVTQGASLYIRIRFSSDLYSALLIQAATGTMPYDAEGMKQVMRTVYSYELPGSHDGGVPLQRRDHPRAA